MITQFICLYNLDACTNIYWEGGSIGLLFASVLNVWFLII